MQDPLQRPDKGLSYGVKILQRESRLIELAFAKQLHDQRLDPFLYSCRCGIGQGPTRGFRHIGEHYESRFFALRSRTRIVILVFRHHLTGLVGFLQRLIIKESYQIGSMVLLDDVGDGLSEAVLLSFFHSVLHVGNENERTHTRLKLVMGIRSPLLIFNEVTGLGLLADLPDVVKQSAYPS